VGDIQLLAVGVADEVPDRGGNVEQGADEGHEVAGSSLRCAVASQGPCGHHERHQHPDPDDEVRLQLIGCALKVGMVEVPDAVADPPKNLDEDRHPQRFELSRHRGSSDPIRAARAGTKH
jgi:hypothetical protein